MTNIICRCHNSRGNRSRVFRVGCCGNRARLEVSALDREISRMNPTLLHSKLIDFILLSLCTLNLIFWDKTNTLLHNRVGAVHFTVGVEGV
jgi:hypothetical protein